MPHPRARLTTASVAAIGIIAILAACAAPTIEPLGSPAVSSELGTKDGYLASGDSVSPFDDVPAITNLDPGLREAMQAAATDAIADGLDFVVTSGWRSARYQEALFQDAVADYGSEEEAREWVNTPELSTHVTGRAVDIGYTDANSWLSQHGSDYGLCQTYANEMWHFELVIEPGGVCPQQQTNARN